MAHLPVKAPPLAPEPQESGRPQRATSPPEPPSGRRHHWANDPGNGLEPEPDEITTRPAGDETDMPHLVNWRTLTAQDAEYEWLVLNEHAGWRSHESGLPASIIPPYWHRHPTLVGELSPVAAAATLMHGE